MLERFCRLAQTSPEVLQAERGEKALRILLAGLSRLGVASGKLEEIEKLLRLRVLPS